jgi:TraY domain
MRVSVNLSDSLRAELATACEKSGRSLTAEVEARLRLAFDMPGSDRILLLKFDEGLWAWLNAYERGISLWGNLHDTVVFMLRSQIMDGTDDDAPRRGAGHWHRRLEMMFPHLPEKIQNAFQRKP